MRACLLHGTAGNASIIKQQLRELLVFLEPIDFFAVEGCRILTSPYHPQLSEMRALFPEEEVFREFLMSDASGGFCRVSHFMETVLPVVAQREPCKILGFSQGALAAILLASALESVEKVVLFCPVAPSCVLAHVSLERLRRIDCLLVYGKQDILAEQCTSKFASLFGSITLLYHEGGHVPLPVGDVATASEVYSFLTELRV